MIINLYLTEVRDDYSELVIRWGGGGVQESLYTALCTPSLLVVACR